MPVQNSGVGIARDQLGKIFDPFYTTKAQGTGLGLSITYGIVRDHQGLIQCDSAPGQGTKFMLTLPLEQIPARSATK